MLLALNYLKGLLLWFIPVNSLIGFGCYGIWRYMAHSWELKASGITIYRWLKTVLVIWALPLLFLPVNLYLQNRKGWGVTDGNYFSWPFPDPIYRYHPNSGLGDRSAGAVLTVFDCVD